jgi:hypothetical protein
MGHRQEQVKSTSNGLGFDPNSGMCLMTWPIMRHCMLMCCFVSLAAMRCCVSFPLPTCRVDSPSGSDDCFKANLQARTVLPHSSVQASGQALAHPVQTSTPQVGKSNRGKKHHMLSPRRAWLQTPCHKQVASQRESPSNCRCADLCHHHCRGSGLVHDDGLPHAVTWTCSTTDALTSKRGMTQCEACLPSGVCSLLGSIQGMNT